MDIIDLYLSKFNQIHEKKNKGKIIRMYYSSDKEKDKK